MKKKPIWAPPKIWKGRTVFVLGGGPSISDTPLELLDGDYRVLGVNDAAFDYPHIVDAIYFGDCKYCGMRFDKLRAFEGLRMTSCQRLYHLKWIKTWKRGKPHGIDQKPGFISWNGNSGFSAINVAYHLGAETVVLLGFDMSAKETEDGLQYHYHNNYKSTPAKNCYHTYLKSVPMIARDAKKMGLEIINASMETVIPQKFFRRERLENLL